MYILIYVSWKKDNLGIHAKLMSYSSDALFYGYRLSSYSHEFKYTSVLFHWVNYCNWINWISSRESHNSCYISFQSYFLKWEETRTESKKVIVGYVKF